MAEPEDPNKEKPSFYDRIREDERLKKGVGYLGEKWIQILTGALMLIGIILSFFYVHIGGLLVGLAFGICFYYELYNYFLTLGHRHHELGLFKVLMTIGAIFYFLIAIPAFIFGTALGWGLIYLMRSQKK